MQAPSGNLILTIFVRSNTFRQDSLHAGHHGGEHMESYATMSTNPNDYINKTVLIFGNGNSAFETANALAEVVAHVWVVGRRRLRYVEGYLVI